MNRIRELRTANGWTLAQLGEKINAAKSTVSEYEREKYQLDPALICRLCDIFGCTADYLIGRSDIPHPTIPDDAVRLWNAYKAAEPNIQASIRLQLNLVNAESKIDTAAS